MAALAFLLPLNMLAAVPDGGLFFRGEQTSWNADAGYKFDYDGHNYTLTIPEGITGKWKICDGISQPGAIEWSFGHKEALDVNSAEGQPVAFGGADFTLETVGKATITFTFAPGSDIDGSEIFSTVTVEGVKAPAAVYFCGDLNGWTNSDDKYKFVTTASDAGSRTYQLPLGTSLSGGWKINDGSWAWNYGAVSGIDQPECRVAYAMHSGGHNITTSTTSATTLEVKLVNDDGASYTPYLTIDGDPVPMPEKLYLNSCREGGSWNLLEYSEATGQNGIYYFGTVVVPPAFVNGDDTFSYLFATTTPATAGDAEGDRWNIVNAGRMGAETSNLEVNGAGAFHIGTGSNTWKVKAGTYRVSVNLNTSVQRITFVPVDPVTHWPLTLYAMGNVDEENSWLTDQGIASSSAAGGIYRFDDIHIYNSGSNIGQFSFSLLLASGWDDGVNTADRFGAVDDAHNTVSYQPGVATAVDAYSANTLAGACKAFQISPGRFNITVDLSVPGDMKLTAEKIALDDLNMTIPETLHLIGDVNGYSWSNILSVAQNPQEGTEGLFVFDEVTVNPASNNHGYFSFATAMGPGTDRDYWADVNASPRFGAVDSDITVIPGETYNVGMFSGDGASGAHSWRIEAGVYRITVDLSTNPMTLTVAKSTIDHNKFEYSEHWFANQSYTWVDASGRQHTSYLNEPATDVEQMKYFIAAIYGNTKIPGSKHVPYYDKAEGKFKVYDPVVAETYKGEEKSIVSTVRYPSILGLEKYGLPALDADGNPADYTPEEHGLTAILVEINLPDKLAYPSDLTLKKWIDDLTASKPADVPGCNWMMNLPEESPDKLIKSMQMLTERTRFGNSSNPGYLFNVDKSLKNYFIVLKGKPRKLGWDGDLQNYFDIFNYFEQISPTGSDLQGDAQIDKSVYEKLKSGEKFQVIHDCSSILYQDHYFCMDRSDQRDEEKHLNVYIYVPDARMTNWSYFESDIWNRYQQKEIKLDPQSRGRDYWLPNGKTVDTATAADQDIDLARHIGAFTNYNPNFAPYLFTYLIKLDIDGYRPKLADDTADPDHYRIDLSWRSNLAEVTGAEDKDVKEQFMIYPVVDGFQGAPLKVSDIVGYSIPEADRPYTTITVAGAGEYAGALVITTTLPTVRISLDYAYRETEAARTLNYIVSGKIDGKNFVPVQSNEVEHRMDGKQFCLSAVKYLPSCSAHYEHASYNNFYTNAVRLSLLPTSEEQLVKEDVKVGSKFYLMREDVTGADGNPTPLAYVEIYKITQCGSASWTPDFGLSYAYYWQWNPLDSYKGALTVSRSASHELYGNVPCGTPATDSYYFMSRQTGNEAEDAKMPILPQDYKLNADGVTHSPLSGASTYFEFQDEFHTSIADNAHAGRYTYYFVFDKEGDLFDLETGALNPDCQVMPERTTNMLNFVVPKSHLRTDILTYTREEVEKDAAGRSLPPASVALDLLLTNSSELASYELFRNGVPGIDGDAHTVARFKRNASGYLDAYLYKPGANERFHATVSKYDADNTLLYSTPVIDNDISEDDLFHGVITRCDRVRKDDGTEVTVDRQFGIYYTVGTNPPTLTFDRISLFDTRGQVDNDALFCEKWLKANFADPEWEFDFAHYNIWRTVDNASFDKNGREECVRDHNSPLDNRWVAVRPGDDISQYEAFSTNSGHGKDTPSHRHIDGFVLPGYNENPESLGKTNATYVARIYAKAKRKAGSRARAREGSSYANDGGYVLAEAVQSVSHDAADIPTAVEDVKAEDAATLSVRCTAPLTLAISSDAPAVVYTVAGVKVASAPAGSSTVVLPSAGIYIVSADNRTVKVAVK